MLLLSMSNCFGVVRGGVFDFWMGLVGGGGDGMSDFVYVWMFLL